MVKPVVDRLERELEGQAQVLRLNAWSAVGRELAARYGVRGVPTFLLFDPTGKMAYYQVGRLDSDRMREEIASIGR